MPDFKQKTERNKIGIIDCSVYQKQLDDAGIPVDISEFEDLDERVIKCIMGGLLMFAPNKQVDQDAAV